MIARPPQKNHPATGKTSSSPFTRPANDNRPPKRNFFGWLCLVSGILIFLTVALWLYEKII
jgi:hypothetical protein